MTTGAWGGGLDEALGRLANMNAVDLVTLALLCYTGFKVARGRPRALLLRARKESLGRLGVGGDALRERIDTVLRGQQPTAAQELSWLAASLGMQRDVAVTFGDPTRARDVASAYTGYAAALDRSALLGANHAPVVRAEARRASEVAALASRYSAFDAEARQEVSLTIAHRSMRLDWLASTSGESFVGPTDLYVSYRDSRLHLGDLDVSDERRSAVERYLDRPNYFDGVLPRVVGWHSARDRRSGRRGLHLSLAETRYSAVVADHYPEVMAGAGDADAAPTGERTRVLTLSLALVTSCSHILFTRRSSKSGSHQGRLGPAVNGNLEFEPRFGVATDMDERGMPDLAAAMAREAREELGLQLDASRILVTGLGRFSVPEEVGTYVLLALATIDESRDEVLRGMRNADPLEGAWEVERELTSLRIPEDASGRDAAIDWLVGTADLSPHATLAGLTALAIEMRDDSVLARALASPARSHPVDPPDLVQRASTVGGWS